MNKLITFLKIILYPFYRILFWYSVEGLENLPADRGFIFCSNHISMLDPVLWIIVIRRRIHFMAKEELFTKPGLKQFLKAADAFAIKRGSGDMQTIEYAAQLVREGEILGIYPEGTRTKDGRPGRAKSGVAFIANAAQADVVPAAVVCRGKLRPFKRVRLIIGKPISHSDIAFEDDMKNNLRRVSTLIMDNIKQIWERGQNEL